MKLSLRSPFLWISATALSGMLYFFAFYFFPQSFPLIHLSITMDLEQALDKADELAQQHNFGPNEYDYAAMFHTDTAVKTFIELEAGGKNAFIAMMDEQLYMPYTWRVRHFKEHEKNETTLIFTPDGKPYGFVETVSENTPGSQLTSLEAQEIAKTSAAADWSINFNDYTLVEASEKMEPSARIDHTFVYEHTTKKIGDGLYRLKIIISGNKMTELTHFVKVPEAFNRRYAEMRSANTVIAWAASLITFLLYLFGGCLGLYALIRQRWHIVKQPLKWAIALGISGILTSINQLPFLWMYYNSAYSSQGFLIQLFLKFLISFLTQTAFFTIVIMSAETLTRRAFGHHPQLWSVWKPDTINSYGIFGRIFGSYLLTGFSCAFVIAFYAFTTYYLGWWAPSEMLFDPNILATYVPWFSPIAQSLQAGFIEECLFRAVPLAGAALLGQRFGHKNWWIGCALILQAIVFGAAHASYPMQPSYARLIELLVPSFIWGAIYLRFGLVTTIITHTVYDIIWFSLPIFVSQSPHAFAYKVTIIIIALIPLILALYARLRKGAWTTLPSSALNESWIPTTIVEEKTETITHTQSLILARSAQKLMLMLGTIGLIAWIWATPFTHDGITFTLSRNDAVAAANTFLKEKGLILNEPWKTLPLLFSHYKTIPQIATQHKFIWQEGNKQLYHNLLGTYLHPSHWTVRYAQFDTDIIQRTEEHKIMQYNATVWRYYHQLPETTPGAQLTQQEARIIAHKSIQETFNLDPKTVTEISATQTQLPDRRNWLFIFANKAIYPLQTGQARINITIAGDEVIDAVQTIHVPEEWERNELNKQNMLGIVMIIFFLILLFSILFGFYIGLRQKKVFLFSKTLFFTLLGSFIVLSCIDILNSWPSIIGMFNTSLPFMNQLFQFGTSLIFSAGLKGTICAFIITCLLSQKRTSQLPNNLLTVSIGLCSGLFFAGIFSIAQTIISTNMPLWPNYESLAYSIPLLSALTNSLINYVQITMMFSLLFILIDTATKQWQINCLLFTGLAMLCGMAMFPLPSLDLFAIWIAVGASIGLLLLALYRYIIRYDYALIPLATNSFVTLHIIQQGLFNAYPGALLEAGISACAVSITAAIWYWYMNKQS